VFLSADQFIRPAGRKEGEPVTEEILSRDNARVKHACRLRESAAARRAEGLFFAEGLRLCQDLAQSLAPAEVFCTPPLLAAHPECARLSSRCAVVSEQVAEKLSDTRTPQGIFCLFPRRTAPLSALQADGRYVCLEHVQDPANVGALLRSAAAFGFRGAVLCGRCADPFSPKAVRASMGTLARLDIFCADEIKPVLAAFQSMGIPNIAAALEGSVPLPSVQPRARAGAAVWIGNEGNGLDANTVAAADAVVRIPMADGVESLNAAVAGGILLWHFREVS